MDFRFVKEFHDWAERTLGTGNYDLNSLAGAQKNWIDPAAFPVMLNNVRISVDKHGVTSVVLLAHDDCGAYGGRTAFQDVHDERGKYRNDLEEAAKLIKYHFPRIQEVRKFIMTFTDPSGAKEFFEV